MRTLYTRMRRCNRMNFTFSACFNRDLSPFSPVFTAYVIHKALRETL